MMTSNVQNVEPLFKTLLHTRLWDIYCERQKLLYAGKGGCARSRTAPVAIRDNVTVSVTVPLSIVLRVATI